MVYPLHASVWWLSPSARDSSTNRVSVEVWCLTPLSKNIHFSYIVVVSFIGRGNRSTRRKPATCRKSLTKFIK